MPCVLTIFVRGLFVRDNRISKNHNIISDGKYVETSYTTADNLASLLNMLIPLDVNIVLLSKA